MKDVINKSTGGDIYHGGSMSVAQLADRLKGLYALAVAHLKHGVPYFPSGRIMREEVVNPSNRARDNYLRVILPTLQAHRQGGLEKLVRNFEGEFPLGFSYGANVFFMYNLQACYLLALKEGNDKLQKKILEKYDSIVNAKLSGIPQQNASQIQRSQTALRRRLILYQKQYGETHDK